MAECDPQSIYIDFSMYSPVAAPQEQCAWCWPYIHPNIAYPEHWSSTICAQHCLQVIEQRHRRHRKKRYVALLEIYKSLTHCSPSYYQHCNEQWLQAVQELFKPEQDLAFPLQAIYTTARQQGQEDYQRYMKNMGHYEPFSLIWERGNIAAGRFFRHPGIAINEKMMYRDSFTYWYSIGYMQQTFFLFLGQKNAINQLHTSF
ncbi:hypothetical protein [Dictyobacter formicarum]|uniref:Uncharacterized protein n=1 Tax=Dictyobacter formicarum TaxID=2778368 RepID=A0ABQ3VNK3_9CHLR|nr:hypothetical protein [Dictyobacter formicarum]GHO87375.1 hypothetical protein KSZ_53810 [Dictyobacter formicarum]